MLPKEYTKTRLLYEFYRDFIESIPSHQLDAIEDDLKNPKTGLYWSFELEESYEEDFEYYTNNKTFFYGCSFEVYEKHYNDRKNNFVEEIKDAKEIDFVIKEYNKISFNYHFKFSTDKTKNQIEISLSRQREFLEKKINSLGYSLVLAKNKYGEKSFNYKLNLEQALKDNVPLVDLSEGKITDKIIYFYLLGGLDFLAKKSKHGFSINQMANILSAITGEKASTIQSYINPIGNPKVYQKNNPLNNTEKVEKIRQKLISLGFHTS